MKLGKLILFHGTSAQTVTPTFGLGDEKHDYGKGFYLTESADLAKEWAVCKPDESNGWLQFNEKYNQRDIAARQKMRKLIDSEANKVIKVFSTLL